MPAESLSSVAWPVVAAGAMTVIVLICRWVFSTSNRVPATHHDRSDLGLLVPVASVRTHDEAELLRELLRDAGIRAGISDEDDSSQVLVFSKDLAQARTLVGAS